MIEPRTLAPGTRVRVRSTSHKVELQSDTGSVIGPDKWLDYYVIRLDRPAFYRHTDGPVEALDEIVEDIDNLEVLPES